MIAIIRLSPRAFVVWWKDAPRWDVAYFQQLKWQSPDEMIRPVGDAIIRKRAEVTWGSGPDNAAHHSENQLRR